MKRIMGTIAVIGILMASLPSVFAAAQLRLSDGAATVDVTDNGLGDTDATLGIVTYIGPVGADWTVNVTSGTTKPALGTALAPVMRLGSLNSSSQQSTLTITFTENGFQAPGTVNAAVAGTSDGNVSIQVWTDPANVNFAKTTLAKSLGPFGPGSFGGTGAGAVGPVTPYSLTLVAVIAHPGPGSQATSFELSAPVQPCTGQIGDFVWQDNNGNGCQDTGEPGIPGVQVDLYSGCAPGTLTLIKSTTTDANGLYLFSGLCAGSYTVSFHTPNGYTHTVANAGGCSVGGQPADATDSDCACTGTTTPCNVCVTLPADNTQDLTIDCGYVTACQLSVTKECIVPAPPPAPFDCSGMKPINSISLIWNGSQTIGIKAWKGSVGSSTLLATIDNILPGQKVTVTGYAGSPNDVYWQIFNTTTAGALLGQSTFHLSCSDVDMNGPEDCGKAEGDGKGKTGFTNTWLFAGMAGNGKVIDCSPTPPPGSTTCSVPEAPMASCDTVGKPTSLVFQYNGGGCGNPDNNNPQSGKFTCKGSLGGAAQIYVRSLNGYTITPQVVNVGESFTVTGSFAAQSTFVLSNNVAGGTRETNSIHTSCSQPLVVGDVFGDLTLVGFNGQTGGSAITYHYSVKNNGAATLNNVFLTDDKLGAIAGPFSLTAGETKVFDVPVLVSGTVENIATASVQGQNCTATSGKVTVTVVPTPEPFDCDGHLAEIQMKWAGSQPIRVVAHYGTATSTVLKTIPNVAVGDVVVVGGYTGSPNDVIWEIFNPIANLDGTYTKIGNSDFHLSCSDADMNGSEDCGKLEGDGKALSGTWINQWRLVGMTTKNGTKLTCP